MRVCECVRLCMCVVYVPMYVQCGGSEGREVITSPVIFLYAR